MEAEDSEISISIVTFSFAAGNIFLREKQFRSRAKMLFFFFFFFFFLMCVRACSCTFIVESGRIILSENGLYPFRYTSYHSSFRNTSLCLFFRYFSGSFQLFNCVPPIDRFSLFTSVLQPWMFLADDLTNICFVFRKRRIRKRDSLHWHLWLLK